MAEQAINIFDGIGSRLATYTASGQTLEDIRSYFIRYATEELPPEFGSLPPILFVEGLPMESRTVSIPAIMTRKTLPVRFQVFVEHADYDADHKAAVLIDLVESVFHLQQLGISNVIVETIEKTYAIPSRPEFAIMMNGGAEMIIEYTYTDVRDIP